MAHEQGGNTVHAIQTEKQQPHQAQGSNIERKMVINKVSEFKAVSGRQNICKVPYQCAM
jgi:hypothetical protein